MGQNIVVTGMVLKVMPIGDYDRRITLLTKENGVAAATRSPHLQRVQEDQTVHLLLRQPRFPLENLKCLREEVPTP